MTPFNLKNNLRSLPLLLGAVVILTACARPDTQAINADGQQMSASHQARVNTISSWQIRGKMSIAYDGKLWRSGLNWLHSTSGDRISLTAPGGRTLMRLEGTEGMVSAQDSKGRIYRAASFKELAHKALGVEVPLEKLRSWITGMVVDGLNAKSIRFNRDGSMKTLSQDGWQIRYLRYQPAQQLLHSQIMMPSLLILTRGELKLTFAINHWQLITFRGSIKEVI